MKPQELQLVNEISKLQVMVTELKVGFSGALLELSHIQQGDSHLREELQETRTSCRKKALRLEALVDSLRVGDLLVDGLNLNQMFLQEELGQIQSQVLQVSGAESRPQAESRPCTSRHHSKAAESPGHTSPGHTSPGHTSPGHSSLSRGKLLLHCFLQGLKAGLNEGTDARHQVALQLLHSEWEYVSALNQLYDRYKPPDDQQTAPEPYQTHVKLVEQLLQRHLLFRNILQERLSAEHWKSLVGDVLVQLIGHNDTSFSDAYVGYTTTLASFLSAEFRRLKHPAAGAKTQREEMKTLSLLLTPVSRIHSYLSHIQNLLQWTSKDHPDGHLLLGSERALRSLLSRCHVILEEDVRWEDDAYSSNSEAEESNVCRSRHDNDAQRDTREDVPLVDGRLRLECWSCSPVRRRTCGDPRGCGHACCSLLTPGWGETSDSGQGTFTGKGTNEPEASPCRRDDSETDDTSAFDDSSVTSCSPDGTLCREEVQEEVTEEEEDSQVPVLLKPLYGQREAGPQRTVALRWQIPRMTPHPPLRTSRPEPAPGPVGSYGKRLVHVRKGSPPLHPKSAFRPIWDDPNKQVFMAPEKDARQGFMPVQNPVQNPVRSIFQNSRENLRSEGLWEESEDSEGPCSTV